MSKLSSFINIDITFKTANGTSFISISFIDSTVFEVDNAIKEILNETLGVLEHEK